ncbi:hypothetical protein [Haloarcula sp. Atlit-47R]|uniref:hypothetical protein n=1 Tax=Haloarcula sp. Atlit-47R TaxID=2282132 RepID=UPI0018F362C2|nr:hypothetical protein [Haloarcula sp. Atlit-47R]
MSDDPGGVDIPFIAVTAVITLFVVGTTVAVAGVGLGQVTPSAQSFLVQTDDRSPSQPCAPGEDLLAKYNWESTDDGFGFVFEKGASDAVTFNVRAYDGGPSEGPTEVEWTSQVPVDVEVVKSGGGSSINQANELDPAATSGTATSQQGISFLAFCTVPSTPTPTEEPTEEPTEQPTEEPTEQPTEEPTEQPTEEPTEQPTEEPTEQPTEEPTEQPTEEPTKTPEDTVYWQVDFGPGEEPPDPPYYGKNDRDLMAALGNSEDGVRQNPSVLHQNRPGQLQNVTITGKSFSFDDPDDPTQVTVEFTIPEDGPNRTLHLASFTLPGAFNYSEVPQQELHTVTSGNFTAGETGTLTISIPQPTSGPSSSAGRRSALVLFGFGATLLGMTVVGRRRQL